MRVSPVPLRDDIRRAQAGDQAAFSRIAGRFGALLRHYSGRYYAPGLTRQDFHQEAMVGLHKAVRDYRPERGAFAAFAALCVQRQVVTAVKTATRAKGGPLAHFEGLDELDWKPHLADQPDQVLIQRERLGELLRALKWDCTRIEAHAIWLVEAEGLSYEQAAGEIGCSLKTLDNAIQRGRRKLGVADATGEFCPICDVPLDQGTRHCSDCEAELAAAREFLEATR